MGDELRKALLLLGDVNSVCINDQKAPHLLREYREQVVALTGRVDLAEIHSDDAGLRDKLAEALDAFVDGFGR